jgi:hypothetical protein
VLTMASAEINGGRGLSPASTWANDSIRTGRTDCPRQQVQFEAEGGGCILCRLFQEHISNKTSLSLIGCL